jgi:hypothetical protein
MLGLDYESDSFPSNVLPSGQRQLSVTWDDLLWAAVTVGRPNTFHVFRYGQASVQEAIFRWSMVRMALQQRGPLGQRLVRTDAFKQMDPTEKGAVNYFLGLIFCKLFASKLLDCPWTLHLDVFRAVLSPRLLGGRSRPDMVAQSVSWQQWHAFECKGRASMPGSADKQKAKAQAQRLVSVGGRNCALHIGAITFCRNDTFEFFWRDPNPIAGERIELPDAGPAWEAYYSAFVDTYRSFAGRTGSPSDMPPLVSVEEMDLSIGMHPAIRLPLLEGDWQRAREIAREQGGEFALNGFQADGLLVKAGSSWLDRLELPSAL